MGQPAMIQPQKSPPPKPQLHQIGREQPHLGTPPRHLGVFKARLGAAGPWGGGVWAVLLGPRMGLNPIWEDEEGANVALQLPALQAAPLGVSRGRERGFRRDHGPFPPATTSLFCVLGSGLKDAAGEHRLEGQVGLFWEGLAAPFRLCRAPLRERGRRNGAAVPPSPPAGRCFCSRFSRGSSLNFFM